MLSRPANHKEENMATIRPIRGEFDRCEALPPRRKVRRPLMQSSVEFIAGFTVGGTLGLTLGLALFFAAVIGQ